jgi:hypothetical protein
MECGSDLVKAPIFFAIWLSFNAAFVAGAVVACMVLAPASYVATGSMNWYMNTFSGYCLAAAAMEQDLIAAFK